MAATSDLSSALISFGGLQLHWLDLLLLATMAASWVALAVAVVLIRKVKNSSEASLAMVQDLNRDLQVAGRGAIGMGQRIIALERKLASQTAANPEVRAEAGAEIKAFSAQGKHSQTKQHSATSHLRPVPATGYVKPNEDAALTPFDQASELLASGMDVEEVAQRCGLTRSEAALMAMLQRQKGVVAV